MFRLILSALFVTFFAVGLSGCAGRHGTVENQAAFDIRSVDINASKGVPAPLSNHVQSAMRSAAAAGQGSSGGQAVALEIGLSQYSMKHQSAGYSATVRVDVVVHDASSWMPVYLNNFTLSALEASSGKADEALAGMIVSRLQSMFALRGAPMASANPGRSGSAGTQAAAVAGPAVPVRGDAFLNATTKFNGDGDIYVPKHSPTPVAFSVPENGSPQGNEGPCVVTAQNDCGAAAKLIGSDMTLRQ